jgi:hypothetical protein
MNHRTNSTTHDVRTPAHRTRTTTRTTKRRLGPPAGVRRAPLYVGVAAAGAMLVNILGAGDPSAQAETPTESMSIAQQLGITESAAPVDDPTVRPLQELAASRGQREADQTAAAQAQAAAEKKEQQARAAEKAAAEKAAAEKAAAEKAAAEKAAAEKAAAQQAPADSTPAPAPAAAPAPGGSFQDYALGKLGGDTNEFACLENLWGKESGWNPNAQNPSSTAYGIPQFLDSTWAGTGIAKTSDGYRQIDAGLIYIDNRYGSPCGAWGHSQANGWY